MTGDQKSIRKLAYEEIKAGRGTPEELKGRPRFPVSVVVENVRSLYNVGSIFRTSDGANVERLYLCGYTGRPPRREITKTALGSVETVPWEYVPDARDAVARLKSSGYRIVALEHTDSGLVYTQAKYVFPLCLVVGNEVEGISDGLIALCDEAVEIPMHGIKQSLNVSVAYGIMVYHLVEVYTSRGGGFEKAGKFRL